MSLREQILTPWGPPVGQLSIGGLFESLDPNQKLYAHHLARAAWHGSRIILRQVSPEATSIFDLILELYHVCNGKWEELARRKAVPGSTMDEWLEYAAVFLGNIGNYYGRGDQKFIPRIPQDDLQRLSSVSAKAAELFKNCSTAIYAQRPSSLGFPSDVAQSTYYPGEHRMAREEIDRVSKILEEKSIFPENTRIFKTSHSTWNHYDVLQATVDRKPPVELPVAESRDTINLVTGDHSAELERVCKSLEAAREYVATVSQGQILDQYLKSFRSGDMEAYRESQRLWVKDIKPSVEAIFGFVEPYRDPYGSRAEFEGVAAIVDVKETGVLSRLVESSEKYIRQLPWAQNATENNGKGPFEKELFEPPDFTTLAYCSSIIFPGINVPNVVVPSSGNSGLRADPQQFNDIRQEVGFKNVMIANQMAAEFSDDRKNPPFIDSSDAGTYLAAEYTAFYIWVVLHELLGHRTSKLLMESTQGTFNFNRACPPISPLTGEAIKTWYKPWQSWTGVFADLATSVDECRAECVGAYLMDNEELLRLLGFDESKMTAADITYCLYLQLGAAGLRALENYIEEDNKWGQAHSRAHFAMFRVLLAAGSFLTIIHNPTTNDLTVHVDRSKILSHGKPALGKLLLRLHIYRCTADISACREYFEELTKVDGIFAEWRMMVIAKKRPRQILVQANTFLREDGGVELKEYEASVRGMVRSWAERGA